MIAETTAQVGPFCLFYFAPGSILTGGFYNLAEMVKNFRANQGFWNHQNLIIGGKMNWTHLLGFVLFCITYFMIQNMAFLTMHFSSLANVNVGLITTIWSVNPVFMAIMETMCFDSRLECYHLVGTLLIVVCTVALSLSGAFKDDGTSDVVKKDVLPIWIPVLFGVVTPVFFTISGYLTKDLADNKGFNPSTLSFSAYFIVNVLVLFFAVFYWVYIAFSQYLFWLGMVGSIINTIGIVFM
jgi:hypothetical protein